MRKIALLCIIALVLSGLAGCASEPTPEEMAAAEAEAAAAAAIEAAEERAAEEAAAAAEAEAVEANRLYVRKTLDELKSSIRYEDGELSFEIPASYQPPSDWVIWVAGRIDTKNGSGISQHYEEFDNASMNRSWEAGTKYAIPEPPDFIGMDQLFMDVSLPDENGGLIEIHIDLLEYVKN
ncbi:MAG: hypothetical protein FWG42_07775 [Clostridiales bacterium]|nr:hypothetical protein [Clostridiales bacterium]